MNYPETMTFEKLCWIIQVFLNSSPTTAPPTPPAPPAKISLPLSFLVLGIVSVGIKPLLKPPLLGRDD